SYCLPVRLSVMVSVSAMQSVSDVELVRTLRALQDRPAVARDRPPGILRPAPSPGRRACTARCRTAATPSLPDAGGSTHTGLRAAANPDHCIKSGARSWKLGAGKDRPALKPRCRR